MTTGVAGQVLALAGRSALRTARQPAAWLPGVLLPLIVAAVFTANYRQAAAIIRFPGSASYPQYVLPATVLIGAIYPGIAAGTAATADLESGFMRRLLIAPSWRPALIAGPLAVAAMQSLVSGGTAVAVFAAVGTRVHGGVTGALVILGSAALLAVGIGALAVALGLRTGDSEVMQSLFGVLFILLFLSSAFFPPAVMRGWFHAAAAHSPLTWMADGMRGQVLAAAGTPGASGAARALAVPSAACAAAVALTARALRSAARDGT